MRNEPTKIIRIALLIAVTIAAMFGVGYLYKTGPQANEPVWDERDLLHPTPPIALEYGEFPAPTESAIKLWNSVRPKLFIVSPVTSARGGVRILSANGVPCGGTGAERLPEHAAHAYQCADGTWEVHIWAPGDIHTQYCIVAHELGHVLGLTDDPSGQMVMNQKHCPKSVRVSDKDSAAVRARYK